MTPRERTLATLLIVGIVVVGGGFAGYQFIFSPLQAKQNEENQLLADTQKLDLDVKKLQKDAKRLADAKRRSLPADQSVAQREYYNALSHLLLAAKVAPGFSISPRAAENRTTPILTGKQPVYNKVMFEVQFKKADLWQIHDFLTGYYKLNILHQITSFNVKRDEDTGGTAATRRTGGRNDLTVTLTTEGIILDGAENRQTLLPVPTAFAAVGGFAGHTAVSQTSEVGRYLNPTQYVPVVATKARNYTWLVFRDMFHGPYPKPAPLGIDRIGDVAAKVGEKIPPVKIGYTYDDEIDKTISLAAKSDSPLFPSSAIKIDPARGTLTLTPTTEDAGTANVTVTATNAKGKKVDRTFKVALTIPTEAVKADNSSNILLVTVTPRSDGTAFALIRDNASRTKYEIEASARGAKVEKFWYAPHKRRDTDYLDRNLFVVSDDWSATNRTFRVVSVDYDGLIVAELGGKAPPKVEAKGRGPMAPPPRKASSASNALAAVVGIAATNAPQGPPQLYRWTAGKSLKTLTPVPAAEAQKIMQKFAESGPIGAAAVATTRDE